MASEAVWLDICPFCEGTGKLETYNKKDNTSKIATPCEVCGSTGQIVVVKKLRKRNK
jgi:DnaJ-class molecular chaperone